ncbi:hypothetical protein ACROYT_G004451 [Oculina patagonica]
MDDPEKSNFYYYLCLDLFLGRGRGKLPYLPRALIQPDCHGHVLLRSTAGHNHRVFNCIESCTAPDKTNKRSYACAVSKTSKKLLEGDQGRQNPGSGGGRVCDMLAAVCRNKHDLQLMRAAAMSGDETGSYLSHQMDALRQFTTQPYYIHCHEP